METLGYFSLLTEENTSSMKDPVKASFLLPTHVLFQNRPTLSEGSETRALVFPAAFHKDVFHIGMEMMWRDSCCLRQVLAELYLNKNLVVYLVSFTGELAATKLALDLALGAVMLQVVGQVAARQLDGAAIGAGYHIEGAGGEVALREAQ